MSFCLHSCARRYDKGARIILNGWTASSSATTYGPLDAEVDAFAVRYPDALIISGAGNHGALTHKADRCQPCSILTTLALVIREQARVDLVRW